MFELDGKRVRPERRRMFKTHLKALILILIVMICISMFLLYHYGITMTLSNVDPWVVRSVLSGENTPVWVYTWIGAKLPKDFIVWRFDTFEIAVGYVHSLSTLEYLSKHSWYVGGLDYYIIAPPRMPVYFPRSDALNASRVNYLVKIHNPYMVYNGTNVTIAILDTGIDYLLPVFYTNCHVSTKYSHIIAMVSFVDGGRVYIWSRKYWLEGKNMSLTELYSWEQSIYSVYGVYPFMDIVGHGTAVASVIVGQPCYYHGFSGVAPGARIVMLKVFPDKSTTSIIILIEALHWLYFHYKEYHIKIVSMSLNAFTPSFGTFSDPINIILQHLAEKGLIILVASGNEGNFPGSLDSIGNAPNVYLVGAWDPIHWKIAYFTSMPTVGQHPINFLGDGYMVWSVVPNSSMIFRAVSEYVPYLIMDKKHGMVLLSGTSLATPAVAGVVADWYQWYLEHYHRASAPETLVRIICSRGYITGRIPLIVTCGLVRAPK
ncbi:MAG: S8 family serine peptidase [Crenarchaeota archaeon]|nr:S8 family serine peptidase [Thermoproteota archaeon]